MTERKKDPSGPPRHYERAAGGVGGHRDVHQAATAVPKAKPRPSLCARGLGFAYPGLRKPGFWNVAFFSDLKRQGRYKYGSQDMGNVAGRSRPLVPKTRVCCTRVDVTPGRESSQADGPAEPLWDIATRHTQLLEASRNEESDKLDQLQSSACGGMTRREELPRSPCLCS